MKEGVGRAAARRNGEAVGEEPRRLCFAVVRQTGRRWMRAYHREERKKEKRKNRNDNEKEGKRK
jgi:hypothetical protein